MADLGDRLKQAAPAPPAFDPGSLARRIAQHRQRRIAIATGLIVVVAIATAAIIGLTHDRRKTYGGLLVGPTTTIAGTTHPPSSTTIPPTTTRPRRPMTAPVQTSAMPEEAFVAIGSSIVAIDPRDPTRRTTLTTFPGHTAINWITADASHTRLFAGVTSGCDPGVDGMYEVPLDGGNRSKIASSGNRVAVSPDGSTIAYSRDTDGCGSRDLVVRRLGETPTVFTASHSIDVGGWSADGQSLFLNTYGTGPTILRFRPFDPGAQIDDSERWGNGRAGDAGGGRVAINSDCSQDADGNCIYSVRSRTDASPVGSDYDFGRVANLDALSVDSTGQWPLLVRGNAGNVSYFADGAWHVLSEGNAADW